MGSMVWKALAGASAVIATMVAGKVADQVWRTAGQEDVDPADPDSPMMQAVLYAALTGLVAAGLKTLEVISRPGFHERLGQLTQRWVSGLETAAQTAGQQLCGASAGGMFGIYFSPALPDTYETVIRADRERFNRFFHAMLARGVYLAPSAFEAGFVSSAHGESEIDEALSAAKSVFGNLG